MYVASSQFPFVLVDKSPDEIPESVTEIALVRETFDWIQERGQTRYERFERIGFEAPFDTRALERSRDTLRREP